MRVSKEEIEAIKREHDLKEVIESYGIRLKKKGANFVGLCPFHTEKAPPLPSIPRPAFITVLRVTPAGM